MTEESWEGNFSAGEAGPVSSKWFRAKWWVQVLQGLVSPLKKPNLLLFSVHYCAGHKGLGSVWYHSLKLKWSMKWNSFYVHSVLNSESFRSTDLVLLADCSTARLPPIPWKYSCNLWSRIGQEVCGERAMGCEMPLGEALWKEWSLAACVWKRVFGNDTFKCLLILRPQVPQSAKASLCYLPLPDRNCLWPCEEESVIYHWERSEVEVLF